MQNCRVKYNSVSRTSYMLTLLILHTLTAPEIVHIFKTTPQNQNRKPKITCTASKIVFVSKETYYKFRRTFWTMPKMLLWVGIFVRHSATCSALGTWSIWMTFSATKSWTWWYLIPMWFVSLNKMRWCAIEAAAALSTSTVVGANSIFSFQDSWFTTS